MRAIRSARAGFLAVSASCLLIASCAGAPPAREAPVLSGRVTFRGAPVPGAVITLHRSYDPTGKSASPSVRASDDGGFRAGVPPGSYYVVAEGAYEGAPVFAFSGQNPVRLESGSRWFGMKAVPAEIPATLPGKPGRGAVAAGEIVFRGAPVENAYVYVYSSPDSLFKGMGMAMSPPTGPDGKFEIENLPESTYYVVARRRGEGGMTGPLEKGDLYGFYPGNPVYLKDATVTRLRLELVEKEKELAYSEVTSGTETVLRGKVVDRTGRPQAGVYAFVYDDRVFGHQRPYGHSGRTGPDGSFVIYLDRPGTFYLGARERFGDSPRPGERFGFYDGTPDHAVSAVAGKAREGLTVVVEPILPEGK
ncbi:MAG: carboxypeptidase regulatory-like domain-containing protein [Deltaproteobacteria bacterium]|nr:MAG: carboxypeptidase regulatory-like domain-containing protein [Deltaproteobacteria bacterium]